MEMYKVTYLMCSAEIPEVFPGEELLKAKPSRSTAASQLALHYSTEAAVTPLSLYNAQHCHHQGEKSTFPLLT